MLCKWTDWFSSFSICLKVSVICYSCETWYLIARIFFPALEKPCNFSHRLGPAHVLYRTDICNFYCIHKLTIAHPNASLTTSMFIVLFVLLSTPFSWSPMTIGGKNSESLKLILSYVPFWIFKGNRLWFRLISWDAVTLH